MSEKREAAGDNSKPSLSTSPSGAGTKTSRGGWFAIPWDVAGRIGIVFLTLCLIKLAMLAGFCRHLFEIHWRTNEPVPTKLSEIAFYIFVVLAGLNLWRFANRCAAKGAAVARTANAAILAAGFFFILLSFHVGNQNYSALLLHGTLAWWDLRWYLSQVFFFQSPFLAAWILVYAAVYYILVRTHREPLALYFTALLAAAYLALNLSDLMAYRDALLAADIMGLVCLCAGRKTGDALGWLWAALPWAWCAFWLLLFFPINSLWSSLDPVFATLSAWCVTVLLGSTALAWRRNFLPAFSWLLPFGLVSFLLLVNVHYNLSDNYRNLLFLGSTLPRYFLDEFFLAVVLLAAATAYRRLLPTASLWWLDGVNLLLITLALADLRLSQIMGIRLDWQALQFAGSLKMLWRQSASYLPELLAGIGLIAGLYFVFVGLWRRGNSARTLSAGSGAQFCLLSFLLLGLAGNWLVAHDKVHGHTAVLLARTSPLFEKVSNSFLDEKTFFQTAKQLGMVPLLRPAEAAGRPPRNLNVVLIFQESSYNKHLSLFNGTENTQPMLSQYKERMELFPNFFCNFAGSIHARFTTLTGLYPMRDYNAFTLRRVNVDSLFDILHRNGYQCSVFDSCYLDYCGLRDFLRGRGIDAMYDADTMPGHRAKPSVSWGLREEETTRAIRDQIDQYATNHQKFFISYFPVAPHYPFDGTPSDFKKHSPKKMGDYTPFYLNELLYLDWNIASIIHELEITGLLNDTLVVITDDHGEMLGENGGPIGHGWVVTPALANIPLIIMDPARPGYRVNGTVGSQVDLLPTILDLLGIPLPQDRPYQGVSLYSAYAQTDRTIYLNSYLQYGILHGRLLADGSRETETAGATHSSPAKFYAIVNEGARTVFIETNSPDALPPLLQFDAFQENFLQNYSHYRQFLTPSP